MKLATGSLDIKGLSVPAMSPVLEADTFLTKVRCTSGNTGMVKGNLLRLCNHQSQKTVRISINVLDNFIRFECGMVQEGLSST